MADEVTGTVMQFYGDKGYGFIRPDRGGKDLFMHVSELRHIDPQTIRPTFTRVRYSEEDSGRGPKAVNVYPLAEPPEAAAEPDAFCGVPAPATEASWRALWRKVSDAAFEQLMEEVRANGWVQAG